MLVDPDEGDRVVIRGTITDDRRQARSPAPRSTAGRTPPPGSTRCSSRACSRPSNLRGIYTTDDDGSYEIRTVRPVPYPIPSDGPAATCSKANSRRWMRPGHTHMWVRADGYKDLITHVFDEESEYLRRRRRCSASATASSARFEPDATGELATSTSRRGPRAGLTGGEPRLSIETTPPPTGPRFCTGRSHGSGRASSDDDVLEVHALSLNQYTTLSVLDQRGGLSNAQLARRSLVSPQSVNEVLLSLEQRGFVRRRAQPEHGRILQTR